MKEKPKTAARRRGQLLPIDSYSLMSDPDNPDNPYSLPLP